MKTWKKYVTYFFHVFILYSDLMFSCNVPRNVITEYYLFSLFCKSSNYFDISKMSSTNPHWTKCSTFMFTLIYSEFIFRKIISRPAINS